MGVKKFAVVGGDFRNKRLVELLKDKGYEVKSFGLGDMGSASLDMAVKDVDFIITSIPFSNDAKTLNTPLCESNVLLSDFFKAIPKGAVVIGGKIDDNINEFARCFNIHVVDILKRDDFAILNAIPTAEGAIGIALKETFVTLNDENIIVLGYGRIGKVLCSMLKGLGANVCVVSRNPSHNAYAKAFGIKVIDYDLLKISLANTKVIFNTVPAKILDKEVLSIMPKDVLVIDLASKPGGVDFEEAKKIGIRTVWALSLPGKVAPETSATIIRDTILNVLKEMGG